MANGWRDPLSSDYGSPNPKRKRLGDTNLPNEPTGINRPSPIQPKSTTIKVSGNELRWSDMKQHPDERINRARDYFRMYSDFSDVRTRPRMFPREYDASDTNLPVEKKNKRKGVNTDPSSKKK